jgi:AraC-like DNA-binding protein
MDVLSDLLRAVRLSGGVFLHAEFTAPWCVCSQHRPGDLGTLLNEPEHVILYHYVAEGRMLVEVGDARLEAAAGDVIIFPHNDEHRLASDLKLASARKRDVEIARREDGLKLVRYGGGGARTKIVCGYLGCDRMNGNPLLSALPPVLRFDTGRDSASGWVRGSLEFAAEVAERRTAGSDTVLAKLSELLFVEAVRRYVAALPEGQNGWLAGLKDPFVSRALALMHAHVAREWTVDELARDVGLSRSVLAERFTRLIGEPPMRYLASWRVQLAAHQMRTTEVPLARIVEHVGYESESAFNRAFKRSFGSPPATWRKSVQGSQART